MANAEKIKNGIFKRVFKKNSKVREILPPELKGKKKRLALVKAMVNDNLSSEERAQHAKEISKRVKKDVWNWTPALDKAAYLVGEGRLSFKDIQEKTGVSVYKIERMLAANGEFAFRVNKYHDEWMNHLKSSSIASRDVRINILAEMGDKLVDITRQRAKQYANKKHPGVNTGYMVRTVKAVGHGHKTKIVRGWDVDKDLTKELRETMVQMAKERGEWSEKVESTNKTLIREYKGVNMEDV